MSHNLKSVCYYSYTGQKMRVVHHESKTDSTVVHEKQYYVDSAAYYDSSGILKSSVSYRQAIPIREVTYWPDGLPKTIFEPLTIDSSQAYFDQVVLGFLYYDWQHVYDGHLRNYYNSGLLMSEGDVRDTIPVGVWTYYRETGEIDHFDTLR